MCFVRNLACIPFIGPNRLRRCNISCVRGLGSLSLLPRVLEVVELHLEIDPKLRRLLSLPSDLFFFDQWLKSFTVIHWDVSAHDYWGTVCLVVITCWYTEREGFYSCVLSWGHVEVMLPEFFPSVVLVSVCCAPLPPDSHYTHACCWSGVCFSYSASSFIPVPLIWMLTFGY